MSCKYYKCERPTTSKKSDICRTHYQYEWRKANPDKLKGQLARYQAKNKERLAQYRREYREKNRESITKYQRHVMAKNAKNPVTEEHMTERVKERFFAKVEKTDTCWNWTGARTARRPERPQAPAKPGYGSININGRPFYAHRASWLMHNGPLIPGLVIDHLCENTLCVNPEHLQQVTNQENSMRSPRHSVNHGGYHKKTHCKYGHDRQGAPGVCPTCYKNARKPKTHCNRGHERTPEMKGKRCFHCYTEDLARSKEKRWQERQRNT